MKYPTIEINHQCFAVNLMDADFAQRLADANTALQVALSEAGTEPAKVNATRAFFDAVFGAGASAHIFEYYNDVVEYMDIPRPHDRKIGGFNCG